MKIGSGITIRKIADLIREKEKKTFVRTNGRTKARYLNKRKNRSIKKTETKKTDRKTRRFFKKKTDAEIEATSGGVSAAGGAAAATGAGGGGAARLGFGWGWASPPAYIA